MHSFKIFLLILLGLMPNFSFIERYETKIKNELIPATTEAKFTEYKIPENSVDYKAISSGSEAALFLDLKSGRVLFEKNKEKKLPIASITKLMTALVVISENDLEKIITVKSISSQYLDAKMGLAVGDKLKVRELLHGLLINSGSDAAHVLAVETAGPEAEFVKKMNQKAELIGLINTRFSNPVGYDSAQNYSTAKDLALLSEVVLKSKALSEIIAKKSYTARTEQGKRFYLVNTNQLVGPSFKGVKTGTTVAAGECLVSLYREGDREVLGILLKSPNRFGETEAIVRWTRGAFTW